MPLRCLICNLQRLWCCDGSCVLCPILAANIVVHAFVCIVSDGINDRLFDYISDVGMGICASTEKDVQQTKVDNAPDPKAANGGNATATGSNGARQSATEKQITV